MPVIETLTASAALILLEAGKAKTTKAVTSRSIPVATSKSKISKSKSKSHSSSTIHLTSHQIKIIIGCVIGGVVLILFIIGLVVYGLKERKRARETGQKFRYGRVLLDAVLLATFLWIPLLIFKHFRERRQRQLNKGFPEAAGPAIAPATASTAAPVTSGATAPVTAVPATAPASAAPLESDVSAHQ